MRSATLSAGSAPRVVVVGGSLGGLTAALFLRDLGLDVDVHERSPVPLEGRGAGIVLHPATVRYWIDNDVRPLTELGAPVHRLRYLDSTGAVANELPCRYRCTSYNALYRDLVDCFGRERYHLGAPVEHFEQRDGGVDIRLAAGHSRRCDLLVCADGVQSTARRLLLPEVATDYAGYVGWRGMVPEDEQSAATLDALGDAITYYVMPDGHFLSYAIPGGDGSLERGRRLTNWLWYRNVAPGADLDDLMTDRGGTRRSVSLAAGAVAEQQVARLRDAARRALPAPFVELVQATPEPFVQAVFDLAVPRMAFGRVCLIGDAAFALRPHAAVGTAKAAEDAWRLAEALEQSGGDVTAALERWEPGQLALGNRALERTRAAGERFQFERSWSVGEPLPWGLYELSDSSLE